MCTRPLARLETYERYTNSKGGISYKAVFESWANIENNLQFWESKYKKVDKIGCGQCVECKLQHARNKANQMYAEFLNRDKKNCWFVTLTYDDNRLRPHETIDTESGEIHTGFSLYKKDFQDFMKRLRIHYKRKYNIENIKYAMCGEYGSKTFRPHYHAIIYGIPLHDLKFYKKDVAGNYYISQEIETLWNNGQVVIAEVSWDTCNYIARYIVKDSKASLPKGFYLTQGVIPEYTTMSNRPGIGYEYYQEHKENLKITDQFWIGTSKGAKSVNMPRYFNHIWEMEDKQEYDQRKLERKIKAKSNSKLQALQSDKPMWERRLDEEEHYEKTFKNLRKDM